MFDGDKWVDAQEITAQGLVITLQKSKLSKPHRQIHFSWDLTNNRVDHEGFLISQGVDLGLVNISSNKQTWTNTLTGMTARGKANFRAAIYADVVEQEALEDAVRAHYELPKIIRKKTKAVVASSKKRTLIRV